MIDVDASRIDAEREQPVALGGQILRVGGYPGVADQQRRHGAPPQAGRSRRSGASVTGDGRSRYPRTVITTDRPACLPRRRPPERVKESTPQGDPHSVKAHLGVQPVFESGL